VEFVQKVVDKLAIDDKHVHLGIVEFAKKVSENLAPTGDISKVHEVVSKLPGEGPHTMGCETHTDTALKDAGELLQNGRKVPKVTLVVTDGVPLGDNHGEKATTKAAIALKAQGVKILAAGVGPKIAEKEHADFLRGLCAQRESNSQSPNPTAPTLAGHEIQSLTCRCRCSAPDDYFAIASWDQLDKALEAIIAASCPPTPPGTHDEDPLLDLYEEPPVVLPSPSPDSPQVDCLDAGKCCLDCRGDCCSHEWHTTLACGSLHRCD
jgi:hypothetical protein